MENNKYIGLSVVELLQELLIAVGADKSYGKDEEVQKILRAAELMDEDIDNCLDKMEEDDLDFDIFLDEAGEKGIE